MYNQNIKQRAVFVIYTEQANSCILKVHYNTYQTERVHSICQFV
jgi:hypothetical protein